MSFEGLARELDGHAWLPEIVAWLWSALTPDLWRRAYNAGLAPPRTAEQLSVLLDRSGLVWRDRSRALRGRVSPGILDEVGRAAAASNDARAQAYVRFMVALDRACDGMSLGSPRIPPELDLLLARQDSQGNLAPQSACMVLRRDARNPSGGVGLGYYLDNLSVLDPAHLDGYRVDVAPFPDACRLATRPGHPRLRVAFVPVLRGVDHVRFRPVQVGADPRFTIELSRDHQDMIRDGASSLVEQLERERVHVALLPETSVLPDVADAFRAALVDNYARMGADPHLRLFVVGVLKPQRNEVQGFSGAGHRLLVQTKQQPWRLDLRQQKRYGLVDDLRAGTTAVDRDEDLRLEGHQICAVDDPGFGRVVVLICEDLQRCDPARRIAVDIGPTKVIAPVMDYALMQPRWAAAAAAALANEPGALVLVASSASLTALARRDGGADHPWPPGIGWVAPPASEQQPDLQGLLPVTVDDR